MVVHPFRDIARFRRASFEYDGEADRQHQQYGDDRGLKSSASTVSQRGTVRQNTD